MNRAKRINWREVYEVERVRQPAVSQIHTHVGVVAVQHGRFDRSKPIRDEAPAILPFWSPHTPPPRRCLLLLPTARHAFLS